MTTKRLVVTAACLLGTLAISSSALAYPTLVGTVDDGVANGQHYFSYYFALDPSYACERYFSEWVEVVSSSPAVTTSYTGAAGFSNTYCQINVFAPAGSGPHQITFSAGSYNDGLFTRIGPVTTTF